MLVTLKRSLFNGCVPTRTNLRDNRFETVLDGIFREPGQVGHAVGVDNEDAGGEVGVRVNIPCLVCVCVYWNI